MIPTLPLTHHSRNAPSTRALMILAAAIDAHIARKDAETQEQTERDLVAERLAYALGVPVEAEGVTLELAT